MEEQLWHIEAIITDEIQAENEEQAKLLFYDSLEDPITKADFVSVSVTKVETSQ